MLLCSVLIHKCIKLLSEKGNYTKSLCLSKLKITQRWFTTSTNSRYVSTTIVFSNGYEILDLQIRISPRPRSRLCNFFLIPRGSDNPQNPKLQHVIFVLVIISNRRSLTQWPELFKFKDPFQLESKLRPLRSLLDNHPR